jgi:hypothetical protein
VILFVLVRVMKEEKVGLSLFVNRRLEVQFLSPAPTFQALTLAAISLVLSGVITVLER